MPIVEAAGKTKWMAELEARRLTTQLDSAESSVASMSSESIGLSISESDASSLRSGASESFDSGSQASAGQSSSSQTSGSQRIDRKQRKRRSSSAPPMDGRARHDRRKSAMLTNQTNALAQTLTRVPEHSEGSEDGDVERGKRNARAVRREAAHASPPPPDVECGDGVGKVASNSSMSSVDAEEARKSWWERLKLFYVDAYFLMFEEGAIYFEEEQEVALWRAQLLMFFFALQTLFEVSWEGANGFERVLQAVCPPFAKLPLQPPRGMEATGAMIRGIAQRAQLAGERSTVDGVRNLAVEAGEFQEKVRSEFETELFSCKNFLALFDEDDDGEITLEEFIDGIAQLPAQGRLRFGGVPKDVLNTVITDLATELFFQIDDDGNGVLTNDEIREAVDQRLRMAEEAKKARSESAATRVANKQINDIVRHIPGTKAHKRWREEERERIEALRQDYKKLQLHRQRVEHASNLRGQADLVHRSSTEAADDAADGV